MLSRFMLFYLFILILLFLNYTLEAGDKTVNDLSVSGFVYDNSDGEALIGANVYIKELGLGASTNNSGYFAIANVPKGEFTLICSYIGYEVFSKNIQVALSLKTSYKIYLKPTSVMTEEVVVTGDSIPTIERMFAKPVSQINLNSKQINQIPRMIEADLLRALQTMTGITAISDFSSALYVRGGTPDQNLYMIDGTDVYNPEHAFGIFSNFNTNAIKKVEISKGGFGSQYGGRLSSVLDITNIDGNRNKFEGVVNISLLSASTTLQTPLGNFGSLSGSFRRTYIDQTYSKWIEDVPDYYFYDANIKSFLDLDEKNKLTVSFFNSRDDLDFKIDKNAEESFGFIYNWGNTTGSINWKHIFSPKLFASFWLTGSRFDSRFNLEAVQFKEDNYLSDYALKGALEYYYSNELQFKLGIEQKLLHEKYDQDSPNGRILTDNKRQLTSGYISAIWKPNADWDIEAGLRYNFFNTDTTFSNFSPRLTMKYRLSESSNLKLAVGRYYQYINRLPRLFFASIWITANKYNSESKSDHFILGYQKELGEVWEFEFETYYKTYKNLYQFNQNVGADIVPSYHDKYGRPVYTSMKDIFNRGDGESYGFEALIRKDLGSVTGWLSYSYSATKYEFDDLNQGTTFYPRHDRSHVVNLVSNFELVSLWDEIWGKKAVKNDKKWFVGINFIYASGQPITTPSSAYYTSPVPDWGSIDRIGEDMPSYKLYPGSINSFRLPAYMRLDLSITYEIDYGSWQLAPYLQIINAGGRKNLWFIQYNEDTVNDVVTQNIEKVNMLPMLPSIGVNIKF
nr:TonB-dependent receptor [uncultured Sphaerochaeta sp.]